MSAIDRRSFLAGMAASVSAGAAPLTGAAPGVLRQAGHPQPDVSALASPSFRPLPVGTIHPAGWLARQLRIQADGLSGHLDQFWPDVAQSQWFGGTAEGWERAPYWLDGAIPLAWLLDDGAIKARITGYVDFIVSHQRADGWYGPFWAGASDQAMPVGARWLEWATWTEVMPPA